MKQKFFTDTIENRFIKSLIYNTPIPIYPTVTQGSYVIEGMFYIFKTNLVKCTATGVVGQDGNLSPYGQFELGKYYPKITERYMSKYNYYDSETHEWLGRLLRCYRDIYDINLMPFYNCYSGVYFSGLKISDNGIASTKQNVYKVVKIPIKYNTTYTVALDCMSTVYIAPALLANDNLVIVPLDNDESDLTNLLCSVPGNLKKFNSLSFKKPQTFRIENTNQYNRQFFQRYEKNLYMLLQVPATSTSSIVVLEGDYTNLDTTRIFNVEDIEKLTDRELDSMLLDKLSLLQFSNHIMYPFSERLIEFLLRHTIDSRDSIAENVGRIQDKLNGRDKTTGIRSIWSKKLRKSIYSFYTEDPTTLHLDNTGYVDKDVEKFTERTK